MICILYNGHFNNLGPKSVEAKIMLGIILCPY